MSGLFDAPKAPELPPLAPPPPPMPTIGSLNGIPDIQGAQNRVRKNEALSKKPRGRGATLLTGQRGDTSKPSTRQGNNTRPSNESGGKMLLGQ